MRVMSGLGGDTMSDAVLDAINRINERLDRLEAKIDEAAAPVKSFATRGPIVLEAVGQGLDDIYKRANAAGIDPAEALEIGLRLAEKTGHPDTLRRLEQLIDQLPLVSLLATHADDVRKKVEAEGVELESVLDKAGTAAVSLAKAVASPEFDALLASGLLDPDTLAVLARAGQAMRQVQGAPVKKIGAFGMLKVMGDPDVQSAVGFGMGVAKHFGHRLDGGN